jgi:glycosyltransferase involved in cell wall biosynthesis
MPALSVIMPVRNEEEFLPRALASIQNQTFEDFECIIVDDASTDGTAAIVDEAARGDHRISLLTNQGKKGLPACLNIALEAARGELIARHDGDDYSEAGRFDAQVRYLAASPQTDIVASGARTIDIEDRFVHDVPLPFMSEDDMMERLLRGEKIFYHGSVMMRRRFFDKAGLYNEGFLYGQDNELWIRALKAGCRFGLMPDFLYRQRIRPKFSMSKRSAQLYLKKVRIDAAGKNAYPVEVDRRELARVIEANASPLPSPMASYYRLLSILVIKKRRNSLGAWPYIFKALACPDAWHNKVAALPLFLLALWPLRIDMTLPGLFKNLGPWTE